MSGSETASIEHLEASRLLVRLRGAFEADAVQHLSDELLRQLDAIGPGGELIIDMNELESCTTEARMRLILLQRGIAKRGVRTAFVADRPRFRGVALFVAHHSDDMYARAFLLRAQADAWLLRSEGRIESIAAYLERVGQGKPPKPRRRSSDEILIRVAKLRSSSDEEEQR